MRGNHGNIAVNNQDPFLYSKVKDVSQSAMMVIPTHQKVVS